MSTNNGLPTLDSRKIDPWIALGLSRPQQTIDGINAGGIESDMGRPLTQVMPPENEAALKSYLENRHQEFTRWLNALASRTDVLEKIVNDAMRSLAGSLIGTRSRVDLSFLHQKTVQLIIGKSRFTTTVLQIPTEEQFAQQQLGMTQVDECVMPYVWRVEEKPHDPSTIPYRPIIEICLNADELGSYTQTVRSSLPGDTSEHNPLMFLARKTLQLLLESGAPPNTIVVVYFGDIETQTRQGMYGVSVYNDVFIDPYDEEAVITDAQDGRVLRDGPAARRRRARQAREVPAEQQEFLDDIHRLAEEEAQAKAKRGPVVLPGKVFN
ncbi:MAG TPA: hypothetical protein PKL83_04895 [bacterium]|nr:hypothetical protein [bacterium]